MCEERCDGALSADGSPPGPQVAEADVDEGEVEGGAAVHHLVEELHGQRDQLDHSFISAVCRNTTENNQLHASFELEKMKMTSRAALKK